MNQNYLDQISKDANLFTQENIPIKKLNNAKNSYANHLGNPIILCDDTVFGSAKEGFLLSTEVFSCKTTNLEEFSISLLDIFDVDFKRGLLSGNIYINKEKVAELIQPKKDTIEIFVEFLKEFVANAKNNKKIVANKADSNPTNEESVDISISNNAIESQKKEAREHIDLMIKSAEIKSILAKKYFNSIDESLIPVNLSLLSMSELLDKTKDPLNLVINFVEYGGSNNLFARMPDQPDSEREIEESTTERIFQILRDNKSSDSNDRLYYVGGILNYKAAFFDNDAERKSDFIKAASSYFKIGVKKENPASAFYLAEMIERKLIQDDGVDFLDLYWLAAAKGFPLAFEYFANKYESDNNLSLMFYKLAAEHGHWASYQALGGTHSLDFLRSLRS